MYFSRIEEINPSKTSEISIHKDSYSALFYENVINSLFIFQKEFVKNRAKIVPANKN